MRKHLALLLIAVGVTVAQSSVKEISDKIKTLRSLDDTTRARVTRELAASINAVATKDRLSLASSLTNLSTEGDFGRDTLDAVTGMLESALQAYPPAPGKNGPASDYFKLARLERYEHVRVTLKAPQYTEALRLLKAEDDARNTADFTLTDLAGKQWNRKSLAGKVVLVNFWATWCPPCRKEMPDLDAIYKRFQSKGLVILALSDEEEKVVRPFIANQQKVSYPVLLDPGGKVAELYHVDGIPKTFIYGRDGKLAAQSIDMRTMDQFLALLKQAGLQ
jgi:peroxiredoxin